MALESNSIDNHEAVLDAAAEGPAGAAAGPAVSEGETGAAPGGEAAAESAAASGPAAAPDSTEPEDAPPTAALLAEISVAVREVADLSQRYHARAAQREGVIDLLSSELEVLRRGERRGLLRPVLTELARLRGDLLSQAATLPAEFDAAKAADLLRSYAETIELALESNGVVTFVPECGDLFDPRRHRRVGAAAAEDPALAGHVAAVRRDGYLDIEANSPIAPAEVTVFAPAKAREGEQ